MNPLLEHVGWMVSKEFAKSAPKYTESTITASEFDTLYKECKKDSVFDSRNLRNEMFHKAFELKESPVVIQESEEGKIIAVFENEKQEEEMPWELWWRILRMFYSGKKYTIFFLAHSSLRKFPKTTREPIEPYNINGGYTYPCDHTCVCIYRAEDATRVLIHELFHASCTDDRRDSVDIIEAKTEAWAELFYAALLAKGNPADFKKAIKRQGAWMASQNIPIRSKYVRPHTYDFPWRYTLGKEYMWKQWGIFPNGVRPMENPTKSLRLGAPPLSSQKKLHHVSESSTIL
jgi:hypothetical protein